MMEYITGIVLLLCQHAFLSDGSLTKPIYLRCADEPMNKVLCGGDRTIQVGAAFYGDSGAIWNCDDGRVPEDLCEVNIEQNNPDYYREIQRKCNGKRACEGLTAGKITTPDKCNSFLSRRTDFVLLEYTCELGLEVTTPFQRTELVTRPYTRSETEVTSSTITSNQNVTVDGFGQDSEKKTGLAVYIAVPIAIVILVVVTLVILIVVCRRRKMSKSNVSGQMGTNGNIIFNNTIYDHNDDLIQGTDPQYDQAATVKPGMVASLPRWYMDMNFKSRFSKKGSKKQSKKKKPEVDQKNKSPSGTQTGTGKQDPERLYSLEKDPENQELYQSYESPYIGAEDTSEYVETRDKPANAMSGTSANRQSDLYAVVDAEQPSKLEDVEGVYHVPRNSKPVETNTSAYNLPNRHIPSVNYENIGHGRQHLTGADDIPEDTYSEVQEQPASQRLMSETTLVENENYTSH